MPHVARYFSQRAYDSSFEPCLKKSKLDYSELCKKRDTEEFIPLQSEKGFLGTRYFGSDKDGRGKPRASENFLNSLENEANPGSSRNCSTKAHYNRREPKPDCSALDKKRNTEEYILLDSESEKESLSGVSEHTCNGSDKSVYVISSDDEDLDSQEKQGSSRNYPPEAPSLRESDYSTLRKKNTTEEFIPLETQSEKWTSSGFSETGYYVSDRGEHDKSGGSKEFLNTLDNQKPGSSRNYFSEAHSKRESKPDYSTLCKKSKTEEFILLETQSEKQSSSGFSGTRSDKGKHEKARVSEASLNGFDNKSKTGSCVNDSSEVHDRRRENSNKKQQIIDVPKTEKWENNNSEAKFSETSTAFIGPLYQPPPQVESVPLTTHNENSKSHSFRIAKVVSGKAASKTQAEDGMNYELGQFYKELYELETATDDHNVSPTAAHSQQDFGSHQSNAPIVHQVRDHHSQQDFSSHQSNAPIVHQVRDHQSHQDFSSHQRNAPVVHQVRDHHSRQDFSSHQSNAPIVHQVRDHHSQQDFSSHQRNAPIVHQVIDHHSLHDLSSHQVRGHRSHQDFSSHQRNAPIGHQIREHHSRQDFNSQQNNEPVVHQVRDHHSHQEFSYHHSNAPIVHQVRDHHSHQDFSSHQSNAPITHQVRDHHSHQDFSSHQSNAPITHQVRDHNSHQDFSSHQSNVPIAHQVRDHRSSLHDFSSHQSNSPIIHQVSDHHGQQGFSSHQSNAPIIHQVRDHHRQQDFSSYQSNAPIVHQLRDHHSQQDFNSHQSNSPIVHQVKDHRSHHNFSSHQSNTRLVHQVRDQHSQTSSSQSCNSSPSKPSAQIFPSYHPNETQSSPAERSAQPPINNQNSCDRLMPFDRTNSSFVRRSLPPPGFQCPPPPTFVRPPSGPPPPRFNYPLIFPRDANIQNSTYHENEKYHSESDNHPRLTTQVPWHSTHVPPEKRFSPQGKGYTEPFPRPPLESSQQAYQQDSCDQNNRHLGEIRLPQDGNVPEEQYTRFRDEAKCTECKGKLVLLRGVPGSGKSTLACSLLDQSPDGIVLSTDDYFCQENGYTYDVKLLGDAHNWNHDRARRAMDDGRSPIIIDNTNIQAWEMKPYVQMAIEKCYDVDFLEPNTWWKVDPHELEKRNTHRVPHEKISQMLERFEHGINVGVVMSSVEPRRVRSSRPPPEARQRWGASVDCTLHSPSFQM
ncbi:uncharacterized protein ACMZJ9_002432 isoform 2-T2 [Mantella aurantiaca]